MVSTKSSQALRARDDGEIANCYERSYDREPQTAFLSFLQGLLWLTAARPVN
jgi:hypothetical protein